MSKLLKTMKGVENFPHDCLQSIFNYLSDGELRTVSLVCKELLTNVILCKQSLKVIHPKASMLSAQLKRFTEIKNVDLTNFHGDIDEVILEIARSEISLEVLDISCEKAIRTETLTKLGSNSKMKNLKVLNFYWIDYLQQSDFMVIANSFPCLEELIIGYTYYYNRSFPSQFSTDYGIEILVSNLKFLKKIHIFGRHMISDQSLVALSHSCVFLKDVKISSNNVGVTEYGIGLLLRNRPNLEALYIGYVDLNPSQSTITIENSISYAKALTSLELYCMNVSNMLLNQIAKLRLKKFGLRICRNFTAAGLLSVLNGDVSKLTQLEISLSKVTISTLLLLSTKCPWLVEIRINDARLEFGHILDDANIPLSKNRQIQNIYLHIIEIHDEFVEELGFVFPNLRILDLSFCHHVTSKAIEAILKSCKFLRKLMLRRTRIVKLIEADDSELPEVNLEDLTITHSACISDEGLAQIPKICPRLVSLNVSYCSKLTTEGVKQIVRNISTLNCLYFRCNDRINLGALLDWMLATGNFASRNRIYVGKTSDVNEEQRDELLQHGCALLPWSLFERGSD